MALRAPPLPNGNPSAAGIGLAAKGGGTTTGGRVLVHCAHTLEAPAELPTSAALARTTFLIRCSGLTLAALPPTICSMRNTPRYQDDCRGCRNRLVSSRAEVVKHSIAL